jgi:hypothetical protein
MKPVITGANRAIRRMTIRMTDERMKVLSRRSLDQAIWASDRPVISVEVT